VSTETAIAGQDSVLDLFTKIIGPFSAALLTPLLDEPDNIEERVGTLVLQFNSHPQIILPFRKLIASIQNKEPMAVLEEQIRFFTTTQTRNYMLVCLMNEVLQLRDLQVDLDSGRLPGRAHDLLKYANLARLKFGEESRYKNLMFAAGLLFDWCFYLQKSSWMGLHGVKFDEMIDEAFNRGVEQGKLVIRLSRHKGKLTFEKHAPVIPLLRQLSQVVLSMLNPSKGQGFYKNLNSMKYTEPLKLSLEQNQFGIHSGTVASMIAQSFSIFDPIGEAFQYLGMAHLAHYHQDEPILDLIGIAELGILLKENFKPTDFSKSQTVGNGAPELKFLNFTLNDAARADLNESKK
jgi:hypothetical protein